MNLNLVILGVILLITFSMLWKYKLELINGVCFTIFLILVIWLNIPCFVTISDGIILQNSLISPPFKLMDQFGIVYTLFANIFLCLMLFVQAKISDNNMYSYKGVKMQYDEFVDDATELYIIGRDLDFLGKSEFTKQKDRIVHLGGKCKLLCEPTKNKELITLYSRIQEAGVQIRTYNEFDDITNLKGQIKIDHNGNKRAIFMTRSKKKYLLIKIDNQFLVSSILTHYYEIFNKSISPVK